MSRTLPREAVGNNMESRSSTRAAAKSPAGQTSKHFPKNDSKPFPLKPPSVYPVPQTSSTFGGTDEQAGMNNRKSNKPAGLSHKSPYMTGAQGNSKGKAKPTSTLPPVNQDQFYSNSSNNGTGSKRNKAAPIPSPPNGLIDLLHDAPMTEEECIDVDPSSQDEIEESPDVVHIESVGPVLRTPTGATRNQSVTSAQGTKTATAKASIFTAQNAVVPSTTTKKTSTMQSKSIQPKKAGLQAPMFTGPGPKMYHITAITVDDHPLPPGEVKDKLVLHVHKLGVEVRRKDNPNQLPNLTIPVEPATRSWIVSKSGGPVSAFMIDASVSLKCRTEWYNGFPSIHSKVVPESRARLILHIELEEPIEKSQLLKYSPDHKSEAVVNNEILKTVVYTTQIESFKEEKSLREAQLLKQAQRLPSPTRHAPAKQLPRTTVPTRPTAKKRTKVDQGETPDREAPRPTRTQPGRSARAVTPAEPREAPIKKKPLPKNPDEIMREWPSNARSEVNITHGDFYRLEEAEYLNDTLIEFGLKYNWAMLPEEKVETPQQFRREDIHIFNSFFYKKLSVRNRPSLKESDPNAPSWPAYETVRKWTRKVDVFSKRMLVIPINENLHWYLAVILNPGAILRKTWRSGDSAAEPIDMTAEAKEAVLSNELEEEKRKEVADQADELAAAQANRSENPTNASNPESDRNSDDGDDPLNLIDKPDEDAANAIDRRDDDAINAINKPAEDGGHSEVPEIEIILGIESDCDKVEKTIDIDNPVSSAQASGPSLPQRTYEPVPLIPPDHAPIVEGKTTRQGPIAPPAPKPPKTEFEDDEPVIMTFDSLGGSHQPVAKVLNKWLVYEALDKAKEKTTLEETNWDLHFPAAYKAVRVPGQDNFADCGVYVLHYAIRLMQDKGTLRGYIFEKGTVKSDKDREKNKDVWDANDMSNRREQWKALIMSLPSEKAGVIAGSTKDEMVAEELDKKEADEVRAVSTDEKHSGPPQTSATPEADELSLHEVQGSRELSELSEHPPGRRGSRQSDDSVDEEPPRIDFKDRRTVTPSAPSPRQERPSSEIPLVKRSIPISPMASIDQPRNKRRRIECPLADADVVQDSEADDSPSMENQLMDMDDLVSDQPQRTPSPDSTTVLDGILAEERKFHSTKDHEATASSALGLQNVTNGMRDVQVTTRQASNVLNLSGRPSMASPQARNDARASGAIGVINSGARGSGRRGNKDIRVQLRNEYNSEPRQESPGVRVSSVNKAKQEKSKPKQTRPETLEAVERHLQLMQPTEFLNQNTVWQSDLFDPWYPHWRAAVEAGGPTHDRMVSHFARAQQGEDRLLQDIHLPLDGDQSQHVMVFNGQNGPVATADASDSEGL